MEAFILGRNQTNGEQPKNCHLEGQWEKAEGFLFGWIAVQNPKTNQETDFVSLN